MTAVPTEPVTSVASVTGGKGSRLFGGALTAEALASSPDVLRNAGVMHAKGLQQHYSPRRRLGWSPRCSAPTTATCSTSPPVTGR